MKPIGLEFVEYSSYALLNAPKSLRRRAESEPPPGDEERPQTPAPAEEEGAQLKAHKAKTFPMGVAVPVAEFPPSRPSEYARQKSAKFEYIELWYFSQEGLAETSQPTTSASNDTFGIVTGDLPFIIRL